MPEAGEMRNQMLRYLEAVEAQDVDAVVSLLAENPSVEDPVGGPPGTHVVGLENVREFFREGFGSSRPRPRAKGPIVTTAGDEAAMAFTLTLEIQGRDIELDVIDVMKFDENHKVTSLRAFWNFKEARKI
jgi:steroid delta-isomerase